MEHITISPYVLHHFPRLSDQEGVVLKTGDGNVLGVLLKTESYRALRAAAVLAGSERLPEALRENRRFQEGEACDVSTFDQIFTRIPA